MDHNQKILKGFLTRINTTQESEEIERKFQWQKCSSRKDASLYKLENLLTSTSRPMWADFQVYIKDASFREEHFCHWNFRSISSHSWVVLILVRKPLEYFLIMIHGPSSLFIGRLVDVSRFSSLYKDASFREEHFCHWNFRSISSDSWVVLILVRKPLSIFWLWSMVLLAFLIDDSLINKLEGPWIIIKKYSKGFLTRINTTQEWEEIERKFQWQKCSSRKDASFI